MTSELWSDASIWQVFQHELFPPTVNSYSVVCFGNDDADCTLSTPQLFQCKLHTLLSERIWWRRISNPILLEIADTHRLFFFSPSLLSWGTNTWWIAVNRFRKHNALLTSSPANVAHVWRITFTTATAGATTTKLNVQSSTQSNLVCNVHFTLAGDEGGENRLATSFSKACYFM